MQINKLLISRNINDVIMAIMLLHSEIPFQYCRTIDDTTHLFRRPVEIPEPGRPANAYTYLKVILGTTISPRGIRDKLCYVKLSDRATGSIIWSKPEEYVKMKQLVQDLKNES